MSVVLTSRGTVIKVPDATPGLVIVKGVQKSFTLEGLWRSPVAPAPQDVVSLAHILEKYRREINPHFLNQYLLYKNLWHDQVRSRIPPLPCPSFVRRPVPSSVA